MTIKARNIRYAVVAAHDRANTPVTASTFNDAMQEAWLAALTALEGGKSEKFALSRAKWAVFDWLVSQYRDNDAAQEWARTRCNARWQDRVEIAETGKKKFAGRGQIAEVVYYALLGHNARGIATETGLSEDAVRSYLSRATKEAMAAREQHRRLK